MRRAGCVASWLMHLLEFHLAEFIQLRPEAVPKRTLGPQLVEQRLGLGDNLGIEATGLEKDSPTLGNLLFGKQS